MVYRVGDYPGLTDEDLARIIQHYRGSVVEAIRYFERLAVVPGPMCDTFEDAFQRLADWPGYRVEV